MVHTAADQLDHMVYGTATSMPGQGDIDCVKALLMDITGFNPAHDPYPQPHPKPIRKTNIIGSQTPATTNLGGACIYIDRGYAKDTLKQFITSSKGNHCGSQPRPVNADTFPWTYGHPEKKFNVSTEAGASFTKEAVQRVKTGGPVVQYGLCHRDFKGTVVLMSSSLPVLTLPLHSTFATSLLPLHDIIVPSTTVEAMESSDSDFNAEDEHYSTDSSVGSVDSDIFNVAASTRGRSHMPLVPGFDGDDPLLNNNDDCESVGENVSDNDDMYSHDGITLSSSESDAEQRNMLPLLQSNLKRVPLEVEFQKEPTTHFPLLRTWTYIPKNGITPQQRWTGAHIEANFHCRFLTSSQGGHDWRILRNFVYTSTVYLEALCAIRLLDELDDITRSSIDICCGVLNMKTTRPVVQDAPELIKHFLVSLEDGTIPTGSKDWVKAAKVNGRLSE